MIIDRYLRARARRDTAAEALRASLASSRDGIRAAAYAEKDLQRSMREIEGMAAETIEGLQAESAEARTILEIAQHVVGDLGDRAAVAQELALVEQLVRAVPPVQEQLSRIAAIVPVVVALRGEAAALARARDEAEAAKTQAAAVLQTAASAEEDLRQSLEEARSTLLPVIEEFRRARPALADAQARRDRARDELRGLHNEQERLGTTVVDVDVLPEVVEELRARRDRLRTALAEEEARGAAEATRLQERQAHLRELETMHRELADLGALYEGRCADVTMPSTADFDLVARYICDVVVPEDRNERGEAE